MASRSLVASATLAARGMSMYMCISSCVDGENDLCCGLCSVFDVVFMVAIKNFSLVCVLLFLSLFLCLSSFFTCSPLYFFGKKKLSLGCYFIKTIQIHVLRMLQTTKTILLSHIIHGIPTYFCRMDPKFLRNQKFARKGAEAKAKSS